MAERSDVSEVYLPPDFIAFIDNNYERILDIREKIKQFHEKSGDKNKNRGLVHFGSIDSDLNSESDVVQIITAKVVPKKLRFERLDTIEIGSEYLSHCDRNSVDEVEENLEYISHKFPLVSLSVGSTSSARNESSVLLVEGRPVRLSDRVISRCRGYSKKVKRKVVESNKSAKRGQVKVGTDRKKKKLRNTAKIKSGNGEAEWGKYLPSINEIAWDIYSRYFNSSTSQLTLPPLHSSVLTLLGQRSPGKPSPRSGISQGSATSNTKNKKLRRHGRRRKSGSRTRDDGSKEEQDGHSKETREESPGVATTEGVVDDPAETQLSILDGENKELENQRSLYYSRKNKQSLHCVLDEFLGRRSWHHTPENVENEIQELQKTLATPESKLKAATINLKEDVWLSFPRTWSHTSATFSTPKNPLLLNYMTPLEYLQSCVRISQPRQHLYNLVFQRYRVMENPLGKTIRVDVAKRALSEILGQPLTPDQTTKLFDDYLDLSMDEQELTEWEFRGIAALCERLYAKYSLESSNECYVCAKYPNKDKSRCHQNQGDLVEQADLEYLSRKIRENEVGPHLAQLLQAVCNRELNFV